jgi:voltage-gated potassium channel
MSDQGDQSDQSEPAGPSGPAGSDERGGRVGGRVSRLSNSAIIAVGIVGPVLLTTAYFTVPFDPIGPKYQVLPWAILIGLLTVLALGMVATTTRALTEEDGGFRHPGVGILLLSWAAILAFAATNWAMAAHGQFVGLQTRLDALYFTGVTIATVGYGDIHPSGQLARAVVLVQLVYTFAFLVSGVTAIRTRNQTRRARRRREGA